MFAVFISYKQISVELHRVIEHYEVKVKTSLFYFSYQIIRQDVYTDMNVVPILPLKKRDSSGRVQRLNAYALDFFKHGSAKVIEKENRFERDISFTLLPGSH